MPLGFTCAWHVRPVRGVGFAACLAPVVPVANCRQVGRVIGPTSMGGDDVVDVSRTITATRAVLHLRRASSTITAKDGGSDRIPVRRERCCAPAHHCPRHDEGPPLRVSLGVRRALRTLHWVSGHDLSSTPRLRRVTTLSPPSLTTADRRRYAG